MHVQNVDPDGLVSVNPTLYQPEPEYADSDDDDDHAPQSSKPRTTATHEFANIEARARNQEETGRRLRSGTVTARSSTTHPLKYRYFIKDLILDATPSDLADLQEHARSARTFANTLNQHDQRYARYEQAFASTPANRTSVTDAEYAKKAISDIREKTKRRQRYAVDILTGE